MRREIKLQNGEVFVADFSEDETVRRMNEVLRRLARRPPTFDLETGQPFDGPKLSDEELRRRGYLE